MRAKMQIQSITDHGYSEVLKFNAVYTGDKNSEDNTYAKATPSADLSIQIDNPELRGKFKVGEKYYVDFTKALAILLFLMLVLGVASVGRSQTATNTTVTELVPPSLLSLDFLTNLPTATNFTSAKLSLDVGLMAKNGGLENFIKLATFIHTNWVIAGEIQNSPSATILDSLSGYGGYRYAWANADVYGLLGGRRTWTTTTIGTVPSWQAVGILGASWVPMTGGKFNLFGELELSSSPTGSFFNERPGMGFRAGTSIKF